MRMRDDVIPPFRHALIHLSRTFTEIPPSTWWKMWFVVSLFPHYDLLRRLLVPLLIAREIWNFGYVTFNSSYSTELIFIEIRQHFFIDAPFKFVYPRLPISAVLSIGRSWQWIETPRNFLGNSSQFTSNWNNVTTLFALTTKNDQIIAKNFSQGYIKFPSLFAQNSNSPQPTAFRRNFVSI